MKTVMLCSLLMLLFVFSSCGVSHTGPSSGPAAQESCAPIGKVGKLPDEYTGPIIENELLIRATEVPDGFLLPRASEAGETRVDKYDKAGVLVWSKEYDQIAASDGPNDYTVALAPDGGFVLGIVNYTHSKEGVGWIKYDPTIVKFDKNGNLLWTLPYKGYSYTIFESISCLPDGDIITIGSNETPETKTIGVGSATDVYLSRISRDGKLVNEQIYGGAAFDDVWGAGFTEGYGVAALICTQSKDGTFSASKDGYGEHVLAFLDTSLKIEWQQILPYFVSYDGLYVFDDSIFTIENVTITGIGSRKLRIYDTDGNESSSRNLASDNARFVPGCNDGVVLQDSDKLIKFDTQGNQISEIPFDAGAAIKVIEYDNYFLVISDHITGELPQPPVINTLWYSSEYVYSGYDYTGRLLWRDAYDNTPEYMRDYDPEKDIDWQIVGG